MLVNNNTKIYAGQTSIKKIYNGTTIVYEKQATLNYLQSSGTQYIDANLPNHPNGFRAEFKWSPISTASNQIVWGAEDAGSPYNRNYFNYKNSSSLELGCYSYEYIAYSTSLGTEYITETNTVRYTSQYVNINGQSVFRTDNNKNFARTILSPYIFAHNAGGSQVWANASIRLYYLKFYDENDVLLRDFVPALDNNNVACLYDNVSQTYFYNLGTGTFSYG